MFRIIKLIVILFGILGAQYSQSMPIHGTYLPKSITIHNFHLTDQHNKPFTQENLKGRWTMMFFGFIHCGYVCPVTLEELTHLYQSLEKTLPPRDMPQIVFVTVDPERDTIFKMNTYINSFNPHFIGLRGELDETEKFEHQVNIVAVKVRNKEDPKDQYMMNHSTEMLLFNPKGELQAYLTFPHKAKQIEKEYGIILENYAAGKR